MKRTLLRSIHLIETATLWSGKACSLLILPMIAIVFYEVISRRYFNSPTLWAMEVNTMIFGVYVIWSTGPSLLAKAQVNMDLLYGKWSPRGKAIADCVTFLFGLIFCVAFSYKATVYAIQSWTVGETSTTPLGQPLYHWRAILAIGTFFLLFQTIANFLRNAWFAITGEEIQ